MRLTKGSGGNLTAGIIVGLSVFFATGQGGLCQDTNAQPSVLQMEDVPLTTVIDNFARLAGQNYLFDPRLYGPTPDGPYRDRDGRVMSEPVLSFKWENLTAKQAFARLLKENNLYAVEMQNTPILRISRIRQDAGIVDAALLDASTNTVTPLIEMQSVSIGAALRRLTGLAGIKVDIAPKLFKTSEAEDVSSTIISVHWEEVTARQAIIALCENFNLDIVKNAVTGAVRIEPKE